MSLSKIEWERLERWQKKSLVENQRRPRCPSCGSFNNDLYLFDDNPGSADIICPECKKQYRANWTIMVNVYSFINE